jgi:Cu+-exporting ATPase
VPAVECREVESVRFKNIADPVVIYEVLAPRGCAESLVLDPVCRMQVPPDTAAGRLVIAGRTYYFCSLECVRAFASRPEQYALA